MSAVLLFFIVAIMIQILLSRFYSLLILETENMATTKVPLLCHCKRKFTNSYRLNNGMLNVPVFVERFLNRIRMGKLKVSSWGHLSGQLILFSVDVLREIARVCEKINGIFFCSAAQLDFYISFFHLSLIIPDITHTKFGYCLSPLTSQTYLFQSLSHSL